jgi:UTP--glucose-1-phosphate uridylyltransferase
LFRIRKAIVPAAGKGTRFLPATKVIPKEMLPIAGRPLVQLAVEEAAASGIETLILVISKQRNLIAEHFQRNFELEELLARKGKFQDENRLRRLSELADIRTVFQDAPLGLAHAIACAQSEVGGEPFAVILPDAVIDSSVPCLRQLVDCYAKHPGCVIAVRMVHASEVDRYGILEVAPQNQGVMRVVSLVERPAVGSVSSRHGIFGRYILEPEIFEYIARLRPGLDGELQLTDALSLCASRIPIYACYFEGKHYDAGSKLGYLQATLAYALKDASTARVLREQIMASELHVAGASG